VVRGGRPASSTARGAAGGGLRAAGPAVPGGLLVGIGLAILLGDSFARLLVGLGAGFVMMGLIAAIASR
jgi:hypothetical protein